MTELGDLSRDIRFPSSTQVMDACSMKWRFLTIGLPDSLKEVDASLYQDQLQRFGDDLVETKQVIFNALAEEMQKMNTWLIERLTPDPGRKRKKTVKTGTLKRYKLFLELLPDRNVIGEERLNLLAAQARQILDGVEAGDLVKEGYLAYAVRTQFETLQGAIERTIQEGPERQITFDDEEEPAVQA